MNTNDTKVKGVLSKPAQEVHNMLTLRPARTESADIGTWTTAINSFRSGNREKYYNLCENLLSDGVLADAIDKLVENVTGEDIVFQVNGKNVDVMDALIDTPEFEELLREIALSKVYGRSVIECSFVPDFKVFSWPRKHCVIRNMDKAISERRKLIVAKEGDTNGYDYTEDEFFFEVGKDDDLGLMFRAAQYVIYKRGNFGDWAQYAEIFGMPFVLGKYNSTDITARDQLFTALGEIGGKPVAAVPKETDIEVVWGSGSGSSDLYKTLKDACNEEILIAIQGETMTTISGSSLSQSEVHRDTNSKKANSLRRFVQRMLNKHFVPMLQKRGYPVAGGKFVFPKSTEPVSVEEISKLSELIDIPADFIHNKYGIPMAQEGDKLARKSQPEATEPQPPNPLKGEQDGEVEPAEPGKKQAVKEVKLSDVNTPPSGGWGAFFEGFSNFFANARTMGSRAMSALNLADKSIDFTAGTNIDKLFEQAIADIYKEFETNPDDVSLINEKLFEYANNALQKGITRAFSTRFGKSDPEFINQFKNNASVFAAFKTHAQQSEIVNQLLDADGNLKSYYDFKKSVLGTSIKADYNQNWLKTEYNMAVRAARMAEKWKKYEKTKRLYPNLEFLESTASNKRAEHLEYVGTILPIEHPWWDTHTPPIDWGCECSIRNTDAPVTGTPDGVEDPEPVFANNPGKTAEFINMKQHPYMQVEKQKFDEIMRVVSQLTKKKGDGNGSKMENK